MSVRTLSLAVWINRGYSRALRFRATFARCLHRFEQYKPRPTVVNSFPHTAQCLVFSGRAAANCLPASELERAITRSYSRGEEGASLPLSSLAYQAAADQPSKMRMMITKIRVRIIFSPCGGESSGSPSLSRPSGTSLALPNLSAWAYHILLRYSVNCFSIWPQLL